jgi:hypothetical protein
VYPSLSAARENPELQGNFLSLDAIHEEAKVFLRFGSLDNEDEIAV